MDYKTIAKEAREELKKELQEVFTPSYESNGVKISLRAIEGQSLNSNKGECHFTGDRESILSVFSDVARRVEWDAMLNRMEIVEEIGETTDKYKCCVVYALYNSPSMFVSNRDFVFLVECFEDDDGTLNVSSKSVTHEKCPEVQGVVRGTIVSAGYCIKPANPEKTEWDCSYVTTLDLGGALPYAIVRLVNRDQPMHLAVLRDVIAKSYNEKKVKAEQAK